jgi:Polysaccharide lyase family 4, domain II
VLVPAKGSYTIKDLRKDRMPLLVSCSIHFWMKAYVRVFDHPYFAITDADGAFTIKQAAAGNCRLVIWHEGIGWKGGASGKNGEKITIKADETEDLGNLVLKEE